MAKRRKGKGKSGSSTSVPQFPGIDPTKPNPRNGMATHGLSLDDAIAAGRYRAAKRFRYFTGALYALAVRTVEVGTMAVTKDAIMLVDPAVRTWPIDWIEFGILHEVGHWLRDHWDRGKAINAVPEWWNIAGDLVLNGEYHEAGVTVPDWALLPDRPMTTIGCLFGPLAPIVVHFNPWIVDELTFEFGLSQEEVYTQLRDAIERVQLPAGAGGGQPEESDDGQQDGDGSGGGGEDGYEQGQEGGQNGSDADDGTDDGTDDGQGGSGAQSAAQGHQQGQQQIVGRGHCGSCAGNPVPNEPSSDDPYRRSKADKENLKRQVAEGIRQATKGGAGRGSVPGGWSRWADDVLLAPRVPWQQKLARCARGVVSTLAGFGERTYARPSRRQCVYGWGDGTPIFAASVKTIPSVEVDVDTSGSMGKSELVDAASEVAGILGALNAPIQFNAIDAEIHESRPVKTWREAVALFKGGGGTDFRPVFERLRKLPKRQRPHLLVFITDGGGPGPSEPVPGVNVIWLLVGSHACKPYTCDDAEGWSAVGTVSFGEFIFLDEDAEQRAIEHEQDDAA